MNVDAALAPLARVMRLRAVRVDSEARASRVLSAEALGMVRPGAARHVLCPGRCDRPGSGLRRGTAGFGGGRTHSDLWARWLDTGHPTCGRRRWCQATSWH